MRLHNSDRPLIYCLVESNGGFKGASAFRPRGETNQILYIEGYVDKDRVAFTTHVYDSYAVPSLGGTPLRNAGDWLAVVEIYKIV